MTPGATAGRGEARAAALLGEPLPPGLPASVASRPARLGRRGSEDGGGGPAEPGLAHGTGRSTAATAAGWPTDPQGRAPAEARALGRRPERCFLTLTLFLPPLCSRAARWRGRRPPPASRPPGARAAQLSSADLHLDGILTVSVWFPRTLDSSAENRGVASSRCSGSGTRTRSCKALVSGSLFPSREVTHARSRV